MLPNSMPIFDTQIEPNQAAIIIIPVPFDATASYHRGSHQGPLAIANASSQIDFLDIQFGSVIDSGISMLSIPDEIVLFNQKATRAADTYRENGCTISLDEVNHYGQQVNKWVQATTEYWLSQNKFVICLGGDHSAPLGAINAYAKHHPELGIIQVDAHLDLRKAYEGFQWSHASIMHNALMLNKNISLTQLGPRDFCKEEILFSENQNTRIHTFFDQTLANERFTGITFEAQCDAIIATLPEVVYISLDIDGLTPSLCPNTGTPVPGGITFQELSYFLARLASSPKTIVGADLCEVAPGPFGDWDGNMGMRVLYKLCGALIQNHNQ